MTSRLLLSLCLSVLCLFFLLLLLLVLIATFWLASVSVLVLVLVSFSLRSSLCHTLFALLFSCRFRGCRAMSSFLLPLCVVLLLLLLLYVHMSLLLLFFAFGLRLPLSVHRLHLDTNIERKVQLKIKILRPQKANWFVCVVATPHPARRRGRPHLTLLYPTSPLPTTTSTATWRFYSHLSNKYSSAA